MKRNNLEKNSARWTHADPKAVVFLPYVECDHLQFCNTIEGELNLKRNDEGKTTFYHSHKGALKEQHNWFANLDLTYVEVLYVYGLGLGYAYDVVKPWLKKNRAHQIVFLEDDLAVIRRFFESDRAGPILRDKQVAIHYFDDIEKKDSPLSQLYWRYMTTKIMVSALPFYMRKKGDRLEQLEHKIAYDATLQHALVDEYLKCGVVFFRNFYLNMLSLEGAYLANRLFGKFQKVPAIICGAGPSLSKQLPMLKDLKEKALIFAGGSAVNALNAADIHPHFCAGIDPNPEQEIRVRQSKSLQEPFLYRNRLYSDALRLVSGPRLYVTGSGGYDVAKWFEQKLDIPSDEEELDEGFNVVNFCIAIAHAMGCDPIIFCGMDLAYTNMKVYAKGVVKKSKVKKKEIINLEDLDQTAIIRDDIYGKPVYTVWKWIAEANWIGDFAEEHPENQLINATEGGIGFPNVENDTLKEVASVYLTEKFDLSTRVHEAIAQSAMPQVTTQRVREAMHELRASLVRCLQHLEVIIEEDSSLSKQIKVAQEPPKIAQSGKATVSEIDMAEEVGYLYVLDIFNAVFNRVLERELHESKQRKTPWQQEVGKLETNIKRLKMLKQVAEANIALIDYSLRGVAQLG